MYDPTNYVTEEKARAFDFAFELILETIGEFEHLGRRYDMNEVAYNALELSYRLHDIKIAPVELTTDTNNLIKAYNEI